VNTKVSQRFLSWIVYVRHSREVDYTEGHDLSCPYSNMQTRQ
jgi:hypothetical protein